MIWVVSTILTVAALYAAFYAGYNIGWASGWSDRGHEAMGEIAGIHARYRAEMSPRDFHMHALNDEALEDIDRRLSNTNLGHRR